MRREGCADSDPADGDLVVDIDLGDLREALTPEHRRRTGWDHELGRAAETGERGKIEVVVMQVRDEGGVDPCDLVRPDGADAPEVRDPPSQHRIGDDAGFPAATTTVL